MEMMSDRFVYIIDDDASMRDSICFLLEIEGLACEAFASAQRFLRHYQQQPEGGSVAIHACIIADLRMPGMSGLELHAYLQERQQALPLILISGHGDDLIRERAERQGVFAFLEKPFDGDQFIEQVYAALAHVSTEGL